MIGFRRASILLLLILLSPGKLAARPNSTPDVPSPDYLLPDLAPKWMTHDGRLFTNKVGFAVFYDYTFIDQDAANVEQVGVQESSNDLRAGRLMLTGTIKFGRPWSYKLAGDYNEGRLAEDQIFDGLDANVTIPLWDDATASIGKQKEPFIYEMAGDAANLPQHERMLSPFFVSRSVGVSVTDTLLGERMTWTAGWFDDNSTDFAARLTGLPLMSADGTRYLHLGLGVRYRGDTDGLLRLKGRPESNITSYYVDTGEFPGKSLRALSLELLWTDGPLSVMAEIVPARTDAPDAGDPRFFGSSLVVSYVLTGENRPYDRHVGYARRIIPGSRTGAFEVFGRYATADLTDSAINGGEMAKWTVGLNWWASQHWKFSVSTGDVDLERAGLEGRTMITLLRSQWVF